MKAEKVDDPVTFLRELGGLHDAWISNVFVDSEHRVLTLTIEDIHANFDGHPGYDKRPAILKLGSVTQLAIDIDLTDGLMISRADVDTDGEWFRLVLSMSAGYWRTETPIVAKFKSLTVIEPLSEV